MISLVAAVAENGVIGDKNNIPWKLSGDLKRFAALTTGKTVIMGRKTFESIKEKLGGPLPRRRNVILSRDKSYEQPGCETIHSADDLKPFALTDGEYFVIGGAELYKLALPLAQKMYITTVHAAIQGDTKFPEFNNGDWNIIKEEHFDIDKKDLFKTTLKIYERK